VFASVATREGKPRLLQCNAADVTDDDVIAWCKRHVYESGIAESFVGALEDDEDELPIKRLAGKKLEPSVGRNRRVTAEQLAEVRAKYEAGTSINQLALAHWQEFGYGTPSSAAVSIRRLLILDGAEMRGRAGAQALRRQQEQEAAA
jgi:hypothetical protein